MSRSIFKADQKAKENEDRYRYARERGHVEFIDKHDMCDKFFFSDQWESDLKEKLHKARRPALTINKIKPTVIAIMGEYFTNRSDVKFVASASGEDETAEALTKLYTHIHNDQDIAEKEGVMVLDALISSRGYFDVRIGFDDNDMGEVRVTVPNPKNVIPDPDSDSKNPDDWNDVIVLHYLSIQEVEFFYGKDKAKKLEQRAGYHYSSEYANRERDTFAGDETAKSVAESGSDDDNRRLYRLIERQYRSLEEVDHFVNTTTGDIRRVPTNWNDQQISQLLESNPEIEIEKRLTSLIRWTVSCEGVLIHDDISPYDAFTIIPYFPIFRRGKTSGVVEDLIDPQRLYNKQRSSELHIISGTSNSGWKVKQNSLVNMSEEDLEMRGAETGLVVVYRNDPNDIQRIEPVQIPQGMDRSSEKADRDIREISGVDTEARGVARADVAGRAIQARQEAMLTAMAPFFESLSYTRRMLAKRILRLIKKFYTEERRIRITGRALGEQPEEIELNAVQEDGSVLNDLTVGEYDVVIVPAPVRSSYDQSQFEELKGLAELGVPVPTHLFVEYSSLSRKEEIVQEMKQAAGTDTPSEEERQLMQMMQELEMEEKKASIQARMAQAQLSQARAAKVLDEIERGDLDNTKIDELFLQAQKLDNERNRDDQSMEIRRQALELQAQKAGEDAQFKREKAAADYDMDMIKTLMEDDTKRQQIAAMLQAKAGEPSQQSQQQE